MHSRIILLLLAAALLAGVAGCGGGQPVAKAPGVGALPTRTPRPTFTPKPTATQPPPTDTATPPPTAAPPTLPPSATPSPTAAAKPTFKANDLANVRSGPGATYKKVGQVQAGQEFEVTGKNADGDWWQFDYNGSPAWVAASMVTANDMANNVEVVEAAAPPAPVVQAPQPQPQPQPQPAKPAPTAPPAAPSYPYAAAGVNPYPNTNDRVVVQCRMQVTPPGGGDTGKTGQLKITGPVSPPPKKFGSLVHMANTGMDRTMQYWYQQDCKVEITPFVAGTYTAVILDAGGNQISDPQTFSPSGDMREFLLAWNPR